MASRENQARWRDRKRGNTSAPHCQCGKRLRKESKDLCRSCWLKTLEGRAYNQHRVASQNQSKADLAKSAKLIASRFTRELGFVHLRALEASEAKRELEVLPGIGFVHFHYRRDRQTTIYSLAVLPEHQRQGWGRLLFYRVLCRAIENGSDRIFLKCPEDLIGANKFYRNLGFQLTGIDPGKRRSLNCWEYKIDLPLLFFCNGGGRSPYDTIAKQEGWKLGIQSTDKKGNHQFPTEHVEMIDNEWGEGYKHDHHVNLIKSQKPLIATVKDLVSLDQLPEILKHAKEIAPYCGRVVVIPKIMTWLPNDYWIWLGFSVPSTHGSTPVPPSWFGNRFVHLLGGSPRLQAEYAKQMNVVSMDAKTSMLLASKGKSTWQGVSGGTKIKPGCYESFRISVQKQKEYWHILKNQPWANDPLFQNQEYPIWE